MFKVADFAGWAQAGIAGLTAAVGTVFWAASTNSNIHQTQNQVAALQTEQQHDHDKIVTQDQKLKDIGDDVSEIKGDVKTLLQNQKR